MLSACADRCPFRFPGKESGGGVNLLRACLHLSESTVMDMEGTKAGESRTVGEKMSEYSWHNCRMRCCRFADPDMLMSISMLSMSDGDEPGVPISTGTKSDASVNVCLLNVWSLTETLSLLQIRVELAAH